ncbi:MAG: ABC transporter ATP-binding protein [Clostridia bacterium]|nr:ABC transporter ATP-binding protein [Clostridia bacterium]
MFHGPPPGARFQYAKVTPPKNIADVPRYLGELLGGFFVRMGYIFKLVWKTGPWILFAMLFFAIFQGVMPVISARISQSVLNTMQESALKGDFVGNAFVDFVGHVVFFMLVFMFIFNIINSVVNTLKNTVTRIAGELVVRTVKLEIMNKAKELDLCAFDLPAFYEKLENANREAGMRPIQILSSTFSVVSTIITFISFVVILATKLWWAALVMVVVSVPSAIINFYYRRKNFQYMRRRSKDRRQMNYYSDLMVNKDMVKEIRMFDLSDTFIGRYRQTFDRYYAGIRALILKENMWHVIITVVSSVVNCAFYLWFAYLVVKGEDMIGDYSMYTGALGQIAGQVGALISISATIYEGTLFIDNLTSFLKEEPTIVPVPAEGREEEGPLKVNHGRAHTIEFRHVSFIYPGTERKVLDDINLLIRPGETLVLVGLNGAGKTTLLKLLTRLYDPTEGVILLDGEDIRAYDVKDLYSMYGIIFQDFGKYAVSVSENIHFGDIRKELKEEEIRKAAEEADATDYIGHLPGGFDTPLMRIFEEEGIELSIGQWQKLAIARAFYSDSDVLILDEPTASLDPMAEQEIFNQFDRLRADKTTIFVSHRLSSATVASKIAVLEYGKLIEEGDHRQLMAKRGRYYELFSTQAKRYVTEGEAVLEDVPDDIRPARHGGMPPPHGHPHPMGAGKRGDS